MRNQLRASFAKIFLAVTISLCAIPIVGVATISLLAGLMITSLPRAAFAQTDMGAGYCSLHGNYTGASCPSCSSGDSGNSGGDYNGPNLWNILRGLGNNSGNESQVSPAEQARRQRIAESYTANQQGVEFYTKGNWARALTLFQEAVNKDPADPICRRNLANAKNALQAQQASQQRLNQAYNANERGIAFAKKRDWANAVRYYEDAARKNSNDKVIRSNLARAQDALQTQRAEAEKERLAKQRDKAAADKMQQIVRNFSQTITQAQSSGGPDFDGRNSSNPPSGGELDFISTAPTSSASEPVPALEFGDPKVVDLRDTTKTSIDPTLLKNDSSRMSPSPERLPKGIDDALVGAYADAPPGVSDRVRTGFQAIAEHDWTAALASFQDALNKKPGDPGLKRLIDLAQFTLDYRMRPQTPAGGNNSLPVQTAPLPDQNSTIKSTGDAVFSDRFPSAAAQMARSPDEQIAVAARAEAARERYNKKSGEHDFLARSAATQMAARARSAAAFELYTKEHGDHVDYLARAKATSQAFRGEGLSKEKLDVQFQKALLDYYIVTDGRKPAFSVGGSAAVEEVILGSKG